MNAYRFILASSSCLIVLLMRFAVSADKPDPTADAGLVVFRTHIKSILTTNCLTCHSGEKPKGKLDLTRREMMLKGGANGSAVTPGKPGESLLMEKVLAREMPPQNPLTDEQIAAFRKWIEAGAPYEAEPLFAARKRAGPDWWSLQSITRPTPPNTRTTPPNPIDAFIRAKLEAAGVEPAPEADRATLIRRAKFDLLGLPPTPEEVQAFVNDAATDAYERLLDRLLASPHYGERWGRHWLDVVRFGESHGYETNLLRPNAWPYRDYVIRAFNRDVPLPQFVLEQLAGDATIPPPPRFGEGVGGGVLPLNPLTPTLSPEAGEREKKLQIGSPAPPPASWSAAYTTLSATRRRRGWPSSAWTISMT